MNDFNTKLKARSPAILLLAATLLFWGFYDRYEVVGPALLDAPSLADARRAYGDHQVVDNQFVLTVPESGARAGVRFSLDGAVEHELVRVRGRMKGDAVVEGAFYWRCARLVLTQYDANDKWISGHHRLISHDGTFDWIEEEGVFKIQPNAARAELGIEQLGASGTAWFDRLVVEPVRVKASCVWWRALFGGAWLIMVGLYYKRCRLDRRALRLLISLNAFAILAGSLAPSGWIAKPAEGLKEWAARAKRHEAPAPETRPKTTPSKPMTKSVAEREKALAAANERRVDRFNDAVGGAHKAGHFVLFASLCFLVYCSAALEGQGPAYYLKVGGDLLLFAAVSESAQYLTMDRTPGLSDFLTDLYGMALAFVVFLLVRRVAGSFRGSKTV